MPRIWRLRVFVLPIADGFVAKAFHQIVVHADAIGRHIWHCPGLEQIVSHTHRMLHQTSRFGEVVAFGRRRFQISNIYTGVKACNRLFGLSPVELYFVNV